jgi:hypothetical protein
MLDTGGVLRATEDLDETADLLLTELAALVVALRSRRQPDPALTAG